MALWASSWFFLIVQVPSPGSALSQNLTEDRFFQILFQNINVETQWKYFYECKIVCICFCKQINVTFHGKSLAWRYNNLNPSVFHSCICINIRSIKGTSWLEHSCADVLLKQCLVGALIIIYLPHNNVYVSHSVLECLLWWMTSLNSIIE